MDRRRDEPAPGREDPGRHTAQTSYRQGKDIRAQECQGCRGGWGEGEQEEPCSKAPIVIGNAVYFTPPQTPLPTHGVLFFVVILSLETLVCMIPPAFDYVPTSGIFLFSSFDRCCCFLDVYRALFTSTLIIHSFAYTYTAGIGFTVLVFALLQSRPSPFKSFHTTTSWEDEGGIPRTATRGQWSSILVAIEDDYKRGGDATRRPKGGRESTDEEKKPVSTMRGQADGVSREDDDDSDDVQDEPETRTLEKRTKTQVNTARNPEARVKDTRVATVSPDKRWRKSTEEIGEAYGDRHILSIAQHTTSFSDDVREEEQCRCRPHQPQYRHSRLRPASVGVPTIEGHLRPLGDRVDESVRALSVRLGKGAERAQAKREEEEKRCKIELTPERTDEIFPLSYLISLLPQPNSDQPRPLFPQSLHLSVLLTSLLRPNASRRRPPLARPDETCPLTTLGFHDGESSAGLRWITLAFADIRGLQDGLYIRLWERIPYFLASRLSPSVLSRPDNAIPCKLKFGKGDVVGRGRIIVTGWGEDRKKAPSVGECIHPETPSNLTPKDPLSKTLPTQDILDVPEPSSRPLPTGDPSSSTHIPGVESMSVNSSNLFTSAESL
ncbi:hypothetical protein NMY22_g18605 [Coprinellus aureogranulatus]|nr:hypothetical protein NMY22_g18605 [Coprinellus aureogranulatus]